MIQTSGPIRFSDLSTEFGGITPIRLSDYYRGGIYVGNSSAPNVPYSGAIQLGEFYGSMKTMGFNLAISSDYTVLNIGTFLSSNGWDRTTPVNAVITVNTGTVVSSNNTAIPALTIPTLPYGSSVTINNNGYIIGMGGAGCGAYDGTLNGKPGGPAIQATSTCTINNTGVIGGGGGGGAFYYWQYDSSLTYGGGGGRSGRTNSAGGVAKIASGSMGTFTSGGAGGTYIGGIGGNWGSSGLPGGGDVSEIGGVGGAGGAAIIGISNVTLNNSGSIFGVTS